MTLCVTHDRGTYRGPAARTCSCQSVLPALNPWCIMGLETPATQFYGPCQPNIKPSDPEFPFSLIASPQIWWLLLCCQIKIRKKWSDRAAEAPERKSAQFREGKKEKSNAALESRMFFPLTVSPSLPLLWVGCCEVWANLHGASLLQADVSKHEHLPYYPS